VGAVKICAADVTGCQRRGSAGNLHVQDILASHNKDPPRTKRRQREPQPTPPDRSSGYMSATNSLLWNDVSLALLKTSENILRALSKLVSVGRKSELVVKRS